MRAAALLGDEMENNYNFERLRKNLIDVIKESHIKIGYSDTSVGIYYPFDSLNRFLGSDLDEAGMRSALKDFCAYARDTLGDISVSVDDGRFCLRVPPEGAAYVNALPEESGFLREFIDLAKTHGDVTIEKIIGVFKHYSDCVKCVPINDSDEFDYLICFADGKPDDFRYCIQMEPGHFTYHRFTPEDYESFGFEIKGELS